LSSNVFETVVSLLAFRMFPFVVEAVFAAVGEGVTSVLVVLLLVLLVRGVAGNSQVAVGESLFVLLAVLLLPLASAIAGRLKALTHFEGSMVK